MQLPLSSAPERIIAAPPAGPMPDPLAILRRDMMAWAEPVIADSIVEGYRDQSGGETLRRLVTSQHRRLWRAMILDHAQLIPSLRQELHLGLDRAGIAIDVASTIDQLVMEELMDIVCARFRSSRELAKGFSLVLLAAASHMGAARVMAS